ncbi:MAG: hypothetical protein COB98_11840 [Flavobacteriaceae bacterium]|nr:MAG: hypothetical protein COB98_11840 [Flavobacteriaceae bacterium]
MINKPLCVLLDDESFALEVLRDTIEEIDLLEVERAYEDPDNFLDDLDSLKSTIFFLDIQMGISGTEIAKELKNKTIIFVSGHTDCIVDVVAIKPVDFVKKPIKKHLLKKAIQKAIEDQNIKASALSTLRNTDFIVFKSQEAKKEEIKQEDILYIETKGRDKIVFLRDDSSRIAKDVTLDDFRNQLSRDFIQINKKHIVNLAHVTKLKSADSIMLGSYNEEKELTIGDSYKEHFFEAKPHFKN